ncbi:hypothetical protein K439DRAFT_1613294 [Ramaria rubella]|nr:hypothetical protein K439DRAFT_1613294 [Ramaria rubella]
MATKRGVTTTAVAAKQDPISSVTLGHLDTAAFTATPRSTATTHPCNNPTTEHLCAAIPSVPDHHASPANVCTAAHWPPPPQHPSTPSVHPHRPPLTLHAIHAFLAPSVHLSRPLITLCAFWALPPPSFPPPCHLSTLATHPAPSTHPDRSPRPHNTVPLPSRPPALLLHIPTALHALLAPSTHPSHLLAPSAPSGDCRRPLGPLCAISPSPPPAQPPLRTPSPTMHSRLPPGLLRSICAPPPPS